MTPIVRLVPSFLVVTFAFCSGGAAEPAPAGVNASVRLSVELLQDQKGTLGLKTLPATHYPLYDSAGQEFRFSHHPNVVVYRDRIHVMWSNGRKSEDENGQKILWTSSSDGRTWTKPVDLIADPDGEAGPLCAVAAGFHVNGETLVAYYSAMRINPSGPHISTVFAVTSSDGKRWSQPRKIVDGFFIDNPRRLPSGRILMGGQYPDAAVRLIYTDSPDGLSEWKDARVPPFADFKFSKGYPEPNWFARRDGSLVMLYRATGGFPWLYASVSSDNAASWSAPQRTNFPSATARMSVGNLPDGRAFCIWNPSQKHGRIPLAIALSRDGVAFDSAYVVRGDPTRQKHTGERKSDGWQYPTTVIWRDALWVAYSVNKEDVMISRIRLEDIK